MGMTDSLEYQSLREQMEAQQEQVNQQFDAQQAAVIPYDSPEQQAVMQGLYNVPAETTVTPMSGGLMQNIGNFFKKNAILISAGAVVIGGVTYYVLFKPKHTKRGGLSGVRRSKKKVKRVNLK
jgi:hypothetical protein